MVWYLPMKGSVRKVLVRISLIFIPILSLAALTEGILWLIDYKYDHPIKIVYVGEEWRDYHMCEDDTFEPDPFLLWRPKVSDSRSSEFNSKGFRGLEFNEKKANGEFRVLAIGDSNTLGPRRYSWPGFLQEVLAETCTGVNTTVINGGIHGYTYVGSATETRSRRDDESIRRHRRGGATKRWARPAPSAYVIVFMGRSTKEKA